MQHTEQAPAEAERRHNFLLDNSLPDDRIESVFKQFFRHFNFPPKLPFSIVGQSSLLYSVPLAVHLLDQRFLERSLGRRPLRFELLQDNQNPTKWIVANQ